MKTGGHSTDQFSTPVTLSLCGDQGVVLVLRLSCWCLALTPSLPQDSQGQEQSTGTKILALFALQFDPWHLQESLEVTPHSLSHLNTATGVA